MMKKRMLMMLTAVLFAGARAGAQQSTVTGTVTDELGTPLRGVSVVVRGTNTGTLTNERGAYSVRATTGQVLQFKFIGTQPTERPVGTESVINVQLKRVAASLDAIVVTALGQTTSQRELGTAQQTVQGADIAQTQRCDDHLGRAGRVVIDHHSRRQLDQQHQPAPDDR
jgi:hypothetical protein